MVHALLTGQDNLLGEPVAAWRELPPAWAVPAEAHRRAIRHLG
ncbi:hypothetical protein [Streptomyces sp. NPDC052693]